MASKKKKSIVGRYGPEAPGGYSRAFVDESGVSRAYSADAGIITVEEV